MADADGQLSCADDLAEQDRAGDRAAGGMEKYRRPGAFKLRQEPLQAIRGASVDFAVRRYPLAATRPARIGFAMRVIKNHRLHDGRVRRGGRFHRRTWCGLCHHRRCRRGTAGDQSKRNGKEMTDWHGRVSCMMRKAGHTIKRPVPGQARKIRCQKFVALSQTQQARLCALVACDSMAKTPPKNALWRRRPRTSPFARSRKTSPPKSATSTCRGRSIRPMLRRSKTHSRNTRC